jgi:type I restriction enzyme S subunit
MLFKEFHVCFFRLIEPELSLSGTGSTFKAINKSHLEILKVPIPPLAEQHRIVSAIEALFTRLDAANERLYRVPEILKRFRQSVLAAACLGKLTNTNQKFYKNLKNELFNQINQNHDIIEFPTIFKPPKYWKRLLLKECMILYNGRAYKQSELLNEGTPVIRIQNLNGGNNWYYSNLKLDNNKYCKSGDLLYAWSATFGPYIWDGVKSIYHYHIWKIEVQSLLNQNYGYYLLNYLTDQIKTKSHGGQILHITKGNMEKILLYIPPLPEQHEIVRRVDALFALADSIEAKVAAARDRTEKLRQSILAKAFSGELVPTEAELAMREGRDYEPADVLLERIKSERGQSGRNGKVAKEKIRKSRN